MRSAIRIFILSLSLLATSQVQALNVVVSIPPLAAMVMPLLDEDDELHVLLSPGASPHGFQLKPSHMRQIQKADIVVSVGTGIDAWLERALRNYDGTQVVMRQLPDLLVLPKRDGGLWQELDGDHAHQHGHDHAAHEDDDKPMEAARTDGHIWLSYQNARLLIKEFSQQFQALQPLKLGAIVAREKETLASLSEAHQAWLLKLEPYQSQGFVVMHDAYQYFEQSFGLQALGTIHVNPEVPPSMRAVQDLRELIRHRQVKCIFKEPQFPDARLTPVVQGLDVSIGTLDPLGFEAKLQPYEAFYDQLVSDFSACFQ